eukprot:403366150
MIIVAQQLYKWLCSRSFEFVGQSPSRRSMIEYGKTTINIQERHQNFISQIENNSTNYGTKNLQSLNNYLSPKELIVKQQNQKTGFLRIFKQTLKNEGIRGFYKGMGPPLFNTPFSNAICFGSFEFCRRSLDQIDSLFLHGNQNPLSKAKILDIKPVKAEQLMALEGHQDSKSANTQINNEIREGKNINNASNLVKIRLQSQRKSKLEAYYKGPIDCVHKIVKESGVKGLYRGLLCNISRQVPLCATSFGVYYYSKETISKMQNLKSSADLNLFGKFLAGLAAGAVCWIPAFPQDCVKTKLQVSRHVQYSNYNSFIRDGGIIRCAKHIYQDEGGVRAFWRGFKVCVLRSTISSGCVFVVYETCQNQFNLNWQQ